MDSSMELDGSGYVEEVHQRNYESINYRGPHLLLPTTLPRTVDRAEEYANRYRMVENYRRFNPKRYSSPPSSPPAATVAPVANLQPTTSALGKRRFDTYESENVENEAFSLQLPHTTPTSLQQRGAWIASRQAQKQRASPLLAAKNKVWSPSSLPYRGEDGKFYYGRPPPPSAFHAAPPARTIRGFMVSISSIAQQSFGMFARVFSWFRTPNSDTATAQEIVAVETPSGSKRRAVATEDMPGHFPEASLLLTPPESRPTSEAGSECAETYTNPPVANTSQKTSSTVANRSPRRQQHHIEESAASVEAGHSPAAGLPTDKPYEVTAEDLAELGRMTAAVDFPTETDLGSPENQPTQHIPTKHASPIVEARVPTLSARKSLVAYKSPAAALKSTAAAASKSPGPQGAIPWSVAYRMGRIKERLEAKNKVYTPYVPAETRTTRAARDVEVDNLTKRAALVALRNSTTVDFTVSYREKKRVAKEKAEEEAREAREQEEALQAQIAEDLRKEEERVAAEEAAKEAEEAAKAAATANKQQLIRPLDPIWSEKVQTAMLETNPNKILAQSAFTATDLDRKALGRLLPTGDARADGAGAPGWLSDETINAWFEAIVEHKKTQTGYTKGPKNTPAFEAYNSGWLHTYKTKGVKGLEGWSRRKGIKGNKLLAAEKIFFPINGGSHWQLLVISPKDRTIEFLDSLHYGGKKFFNIAREWLAMELGKDYVKSEWMELGSTSETQDNMSDCGVFTCMNALAVAKGRAFNEVETGRMMEARRMMVAVLLNGGLKGDWEL